MIHTLSQISWILFGFAIGQLLRRTGVAKEHDASFLFRLAFYVCVPALVFNSLATVRLTQHLLIFSLFSTLLVVAGYVVARIVVRRLSLSELQAPVFLVAAMGVNTVFAIPFLQSLYGAEGLARYIAVDVANTILLYTWAYSIAVRANPAHAGAEGAAGVLTRKLLTSPPLYGVMLGLLVNLLDVHVPEFILDATHTFSMPTGLLVTLGVGMMLDPKRSELSVALRKILVRTGTATTVGLVFIFAFGLTGVDRATILLFCAAPIAFSSATFASLENLDTRFAAGSLSISLIAGIFLATTVSLVFV